MLRLESDVQYVKGVGPRRSALFASRGIRTVDDLLFHIPKAYQDRATFQSLDKLVVGQDATVHVRVYGSRTIRTRTRGQIVDVVVTDGTSFAHVKWFHGGRMQQNRMFPAGRELILFGRVDFDSRESGMVFFNPEFELVEETDNAASLDVGRCVPIYEEIAGLTSRQLRRLVSSALKELDPELQDPLPEALRQAHQFPDLRTCLQRIHFPTPDDDIQALNLSLIHI